MRRPQTLDEVASWSNDSTTFWYNVRDFLDEFRRLQRAAMLSGEPARRANVFTEGEIADAYLAAVAVSLAREVGVPPPMWARDASRRLVRPWFANAGARLRATLLAESPAPFRERNLFVSANALSRA
jgi:hypothetical protein